MSGQDIWGWKVAAYLFVAGTGAGAYAVGAAGERLGGLPPGATAAGLLLGPVLVGPATLFLICDLGRPAGFLRAGRRPGSSWISRGVFILSGFLLVSAAHVALALGPLEALAGAARGALAPIGGALALLTMAYTGLLLGAIRPIPLWSTPVLPLLFLVASLSTGVMAIDLGLAGWGAVARGPADGALGALRGLELLLLALEALVLALYLGLAHATAAARAARSLLTAGALARRFWGGVVLLGLGVPFALELAAVTLPASAGAWYGWVASLSGLLGGLLLRHVVVAAGVKSPLIAAGVAFAAPGPARS